MSSSSKHTGRLEEPFIILAVLSLLGGSIWLVVRAPLLLEFYYSNELLALTHTFTLGFVTSLIMGVTYRLAPMALFVLPRSRRWARIHFWVHALGVLGMIFYFWLPAWHGLAWSALLVLCSALLQLYVWWDIRFPARGDSWVARYVLTAMVYLVVAALLGTWMGVRKGMPDLLPSIGGTFTGFLFAHAHLAGLGWVTTMILGWHLRLWPRTQGNRRLWPVRYAVLQIGTLGLIAGWLWNLPGKPLFATLVLAVIIWHGWGAFVGFVRGRAREGELAALVMLILAASAGLALALGLPQAADPLRGRIQMAYGLVGLVGWFVLTIVIFAFKLFPMWVWQECFGADYGKKPVPGMRDLYHHGLKRVSQWAYVLGLCMSAAGIVAGYLPVLQFGLGLILVGTLTFLTNFVRMARWALLKTEFRPTPGDWDEFRRLFPNAATGSDPAADR